MRYKMSIQPQSLWGWTRFALNMFLISGIAVIMSACTIPKQMRVDTGLHPKYQDKRVRFRTTYYFRVFDYCVDEEREGIKPPFAIDSLYRFRMTGKARALTNAIHFESGTLLASQIDPFGANIAYDEKNRQFYFKSQAETKQEAEREKQFEELHRLLDEFKKLRGELEDPTGEDKSLLDAFKQIIERQITRIQGPELSLSSPKPLVFKLTEQSLADLKVKTSNNILESLEPLKDKTYNTKEEFLEAVMKAIGNDLTNSDKALILEHVEKKLSKAYLSKTREDYCKELRRGFQILGPEGWRTFDQDERLILAMSSSAKPLISTLRELSGRILDNQPIEAELLLPILKEDLRITRTEGELSKFAESNADKFLDILNAAIQRLQEE